MIKLIRWAGQAACCGLIVLLAQTGNSTFADTPPPGVCPLPCGGGCICIPNAKDYGYFPTVWRQWPGEPRPDITFPQSVGIEAIPTPQPEPPQPPLPEVMLEDLPVEPTEEEAPLEGELPPFRGTTPPLPGTTPPGAIEPQPTRPEMSLPGRPLPKSPANELPQGMIRGLPKEPTDAGTSPKEIPAESSGGPSEPAIDSLDDKKDGIPLEPGLDGAFRPYFMPRLPIPLPQQPAGPSPRFPQQNLVEGPKLVEAVEPLLPEKTGETAEETAKAIPPEEAAQSPSNPPQKLAELESSARPLYKVIEKKPVIEKNPVIEKEPERNEDVVPHAVPVEERLPEPVPRAPRLSRAPSPAQAAQPFTEESTPAVPLEARPNEPQSLAPPGEAIVEPMLPAAPEQPDTEPPGYAEVESASLPEIPASPRANWASALDPGFRSGNGRVTFSSNDLIAALDGYCPVELVEKEHWAPGNSSLSVVHQGQTYFLSSFTARKHFLADPDRYAPAYRGHDAVLLVDEGRRVSGLTDYCVTCNGRLYSFSCEETLQRFRKNPKKYAASDGK